MTALLNTLKERFEANTHRHPNISWEQVKSSIDNNELIDSLLYMEETGGEPDVYDIDCALYYIDASPETPTGRRSLSYDKEARISRKKNAPESSALEEATKHKLELLTVEEYKYIQSLDDLDQKTSSWVLTPDIIRGLGGALFGDKRYAHTFIYHNGADSYYASRSFRAKLKL